MDFVKNVKQFWTKGLKRGDRVSRDVFFFVLLICVLVGFIIFLINRSFVSFSILSNILIAISIIMFVA